MKRIFLIRHGETDWNREGRFQGKMDIPLNSLGREQAGAAAKALESAAIDRVVSSPLSRAFDTAQAAASRNSFSIEMHSGFREIDHGLWEGHTADQVENLWPGMLGTWHSHPEKVIMPEGESLENVQNRAWTALEDVIAAPGERVALFSHDAVIKVLLCQILGCPLSSFWQFRIANASITLLEADAKGISLLVMGDACHLGSPWERKEQKGL
ncbi:MAG TPA: histidine phosphatase family protein [Synergistales bacterium]|nr:histidine phosphatase family protein [Synergistales bacterium]